MRLESAQNALRAPPGGNRNGQATNPGRSCNFGLSARHATSAPETIDWRKKLAARDANAAILSRDPPGGEKRMLVQVAPATAARPTGRSAGAHPEIRSQKASKNIARKAAARLRSGRASPVCAFNGQIQRALATRFAIAAREGAAGRKSAQGGRWRGSASVIPIRVARRGAELSCSPKQGKHWGGRAEMRRLRNHHPDEAKEAKEKTWKGHAQNGSAVMAPMAGVTSRRQDSSGRAGAASHGPDKKRGGPRSAPQTKQPRWFARSPWRPWISSSERPARPEPYSSCAYGGLIPLRDDARRGSRAVDGVCAIL